MAMSDYWRSIRRQVGTQLLLIPSVAAVIRDRRGHILCQRRRDTGGWSLPAGAIEPGETPDEAIVREVFEETGLEIVPERMLGAWGGRGFRLTYPNGDTVEYTVVVYACRAVGGTLGPVDDESAGLFYFAAEDMPDLGLPYPPALFAVDSDPANRPSLP